MGTPKSPRHLAPSVGRSKCWLDLQASEAELILCNGDEKMKRGMAAPTPHVTAPRQQRPRCGGACCASPLRHLRAGAVARSGDARCAPPYNTSASAQGFLSSNHQDSPAATWRRLKPFSQCEAWGRPLWPGGSLPSSPPSPGPSLSWCCCKQDSATRRGGLMPAPRSSRRTTALLHAPCSSK